MVRILWLWKERTHDARRLRKSTNPGAIFAGPEYSATMKTVSRQFLAAAAGSLAASFACAAWPDPATEEVIVEGTRPEIEQRASTFVTGVTHRGYMAESLVRWNKEICPLVAGIPPDQGEFILRGISQAVLAAGAKLAAENCKPNFHVVLTPEPDRLLDLWRKRAPKLYGMAQPAKVRRILGKPRPVRAFLKALYQTSQVDKYQRTEIARAMVNDIMAR
jgi:hypothetical protein